MWRSISALDLIVIPADLSLLYGALNQLSVRISCIQIRSRNLLLVIEGCYLMRSNLLSLLLVMALQLVQMWHFSPSNWLLKLRIRLFPTTLSRSVSEYQHVYLLDGLRGVELVAIDDLELWTTLVI